MLTTNLFAHADPGEAHEFASKPINEIAFVDVMTDENMIRETLQVSTVDSIYRVVLTHALL